MSSLRQSGACSSDPVRYAITLGILCVGVIGPLAAQDLERDSLRFVFDTSTRVEAKDNFGLSATNPQGGLIATQSLGIAVLSDTRNQTFAFGLGALYQLGDIPGTGIGTGWRDPSVSLAYSRENITSILSISTDFRRQDLGLGRVIPELDDETLLPSDLIDDLGQLARAISSVQLELGRGEPTGLTLGANFDLRNYNSTTNPDLFDRRTYNLTSDLRLDVSPSLQLNLLASRSRYEADNTEATTRDTSRLGVRVNARLDAANSISAGLTYDHISTDEIVAGMPSDTTIRGTSGTLGFSRDLPRGGLSVTLASTFSTLERRNSLTFGRRLDLAHARLNLEIGATGTADGTQVIGAIDYTLDLARGSFTAGLERSARTTSEDEAILQTVTRLSHNTRINTVSGLEFSANYARIDGLTDSADDVSRGTISASYNYAVTRDWSLNFGVSHTRENDTSSNAIFMSLGRKATVRW